LPNRATLREQLNQPLAQAERGLGFALLNLDLDQFKRVNDTLGHLAGDKVLCAVAKRLQELVREVDTVARVGGTNSVSFKLASRIVAAVSQPYEVDGHQVVIGVSIGIALAPRDSAHPAQLLQNADLALSLAKLDGKLPGASSSQRWMCWQRRAAKWNSTCAMPCRWASWSYITSPSWIFEPE
jgi:diguanylate cyclase (GGDEF)-like protein